ncbi:MAG: DUF21 domain-containing protein [Planctomycetes bacterium]|nr:DUF21 domain-containing protein [Planctomycetota bacterium]
MITAICIIAALGAVAMSGFYSGSETGLYSVSRLRIQVGSESGDPAAQRLCAILKDDQAALSTLLVGTNVSNYLATVFVAYLLTRTLDASASKSELYTTAIVTPIIFVFGEIIPKTLFQRHAGILMPMGSRLFAWSCFAFSIPVKILNLVSLPLLKLAGGDGAAASSDHRRNIAVMLQDAFATEQHGDVHVELVDRVLNLSKQPLHQVMVPRNRVVGIDLRATQSECLAVIRKNVHSRLLVFDRDPRRVVGFVSTHTLLADDQWRTIESYLCPMQTFAPHQSVAEAMMALQSKGGAIAAITDRTGRLLGIVTLKDLLEELSGELHDW